MPPRCWRRLPQRTPPRIRSKRFPKNRYQQAAPRPPPGARGRVGPTAAAEAAWARVIVALLPLLGLLGTVTGMIESFETLSAAGGSDPGGLTGGISAALLTTLAGLVTALPGVFAVHRLERRTDRLADKVRARLRRFMRPSCCRS